MLNYTATYRSWDKKLGGNTKDITETSRIYETEINDLKERFLKGIDEVSIDIPKTDSLIDEFINTNAKIKENIDINKINESIINPLSRISDCVSIGEYIAALNGNADWNNGLIRRNSQADNAEPSRASLCFRGRCNA